MFRSIAPAFIKKLVWDRRYQNAKTNPDTCPRDLLGHLSSIDRSASVLDLGCGAGNLLVAMRRRGWAGHFTGVDVSEQAIETARNIGDAKAQWHISTIEDFNISPGAFKAISLCETIYYVRQSRLEETLAKCLAGLAPAGALYIRIVHADCHRHYVERLKSIGARFEAPMFIVNIPA